MRLTLSKAALPLYCPWPFAEGREPAMPIPRGAFNLLGQGFHMLCAGLINNGEYDPVGVVTSLGLKGEQDENVAALLRMLPFDHASRILDHTTKARAEVAYALDPKTGKGIELGVDIHRKYDAHGLPEGWWGGSSDVVWTEWDPETEQNILVVHDWKVIFGGGRHVAPPEQNAQLQLLALAAMRAARIHRARLQVQRVEEYGESKLQTAWVDDMSVLATLKRIREALARAPTCQPRPGRHCLDHYCPMLAQCPATREAFEQIVEHVTQLPATVRFPVATRAEQITSAEHAAYMLGVAQRVHKASEAVIDAVKEYARRHGPVPVGDGLVYGPVDETRTAIHASSVKILVEAIAEFVGGEDAARRIVMAGVKKEALSKAVHDAAPKKQGNARLDECIAKLTDQHMCRVVRSGEVFRIKKEKKDE
jgi:hypothetical protein